MQETAAQSAQAFTAKAIEFYVKYAQAASETGAAYYKAQAEKYERFAATANERAQSQAPAAVQTALVAVQSPAKPVKARCAHYKAIQAFAATARATGLDMKAKDRSRGAVGALLGHRIESRADLTGAQWAQATAAIKAGNLFW